MSETPRDRPATLADVSGEANRRSWNAATRAHNRHKGDQAARLREGWSTLFPEELELLGDLQGRTLLHLQCNAGQDSLCLARLGALVTGVDLADEAIAAASALSRDTGIPLELHRADLYEWLARAAAEPRCFQRVFASYGVVGWLPDLDSWARGIANVLAPGGALVLVEFHPLIWCLDGQWRLIEGYGGGTPIGLPEGVMDYVEEAADGLVPWGATTVDEPFHNPHPAVCYNWSVEEVVDSVCRAGLVVEKLRLYPFSNGCRMRGDLLPAAHRRFVLPPGAPPLPLMFGMLARRPRTESARQPPTAAAAGESR